MMMLDELVIGVSGELMVVDETLLVDKCLNDDFVSFVSVVVVGLLLLTPK